MSSPATLCDSVWIRDSLEARKSTARSHTRFIFFLQATARKEMSTPKLLVLPSLQQVWSWLPPVPCAGIKQNLVSRFQTRAWPHKSCLGEDERLTQCPEFLLQFVLQRDSSKLPSPVLHTDLSQGDTLMFTPALDPAVVSFSHPGMLKELQSSLAGKGILCLIHREDV